MFIHLLAGSLIFLFLGKYYNLEVNSLFLFIGACFGIMPDVVGALLKFNFIFYRWTHEHRDDIFHTIFFPIIVFIVGYLIFGFELAIVFFLAVLSHALLDIIGVGWGIKLFYPFSQKNYKLFSNGKFIQIWNKKALDKLIKKYHEPNWFFKILFTFNCSRVPWWYGALEWTSLASFILLLIWV